VFQPPHLEGSSAVLRGVEPSGEPSLGWLTAGAQLPPLRQLVFIELGYQNQYQILNSMTKPNIV
jgi:hypothetical protein